MRWLRFGSRVARLLGCLKIVLAEGGGTPGARGGMTLPETLEGPHGFLRRKQNQLMVYRPSTAGVWTMRNWTNKRNR